MKRRSRMMTIRVCPLFRFLLFFPLFFIRKLFSRALLFLPHVNHEYAAIKHCNTSISLHYCQRSRQRLVGTEFFNDPTLLLPVGGKCYMFANDMSKLLKLYNYRPYEKKDKRKNKYVYIIVNIKPSIS